MKVCFVMCHTGEDFGILSDLQYSRHTGYEQWYCKAVMNQGWDATLIVLSYRPGITEFQHVFGHKIVRVPVSLSLGVSKQLSTSLFDLINNDLKDVDIFHINSCYALLYEPLAFFLRHIKKRFIVQSHSAHYSLRNPFHLARLGSLLFSLRLAEKVLTVNPWEFMKFVKSYRLRNAILFPNGVDTSIFKGMNLERKKNSLLYVGRLWPEKGVSILLKAFEMARKEIPDISLTIVGWGPLESLVLEMQKKYQNQISYLSYIPSIEDLTEVYRTHELFVLPSLNEPFGIAVLESLACNTPVVTSNNCGAAFFLNKYDCVETVTPSNPIDLSEKIVQLLKNPNKLQNMGKMGREAVVKNFDWKILGKRLAGIYGDILA